MTLFANKKLISHSGIPLDFKIECDSLTDEDLETLAKIIASKYKFKYVQGIPSGGTKLEKCLSKYNDERYDQILLVNDVLTTGKSMEKFKMEYTIVTKSKIHGVVIFARTKCPNWITPIFQFWETENK